MASEVEGNDVVGSGEFRGDMVPPMSIRPTPVKQDQERLPPIAPAERL